MEESNIHDDAALMSPNKDSSPSHEQPSPEAHQAPHPEPL